MCSCADTYTDEAGTEGGNICGLIVVRCFRLRVFFRDELDEVFKVWEEWGEE